MAPETSPLVDDEHGDHCTLSVSNGGEFVLLVAATPTELNPSGIPTHDGQMGKWREKLTDRGFGEKFNRRTTKCAATGANALVIHKRWRDALRFDSELAADEFRRHLYAALLRDRVSNVHAGWKVNQEVPPEAAELQMRPEPEMQLAPYQQVGVVASRMVPGYGFFLEQGCGKTPMAVCRAATDAVKLRRSGTRRMYRALVVAPKNVRANWEREFKRFTPEHVPFKVNTMRLGKVGRIKEMYRALDQPNGEMMSVVVISYGLLVEAWDSLLSHMQWDLGIIDEGHGIKSHQTDRTAVCLQLRDRCAARLILTGTPVVNSALDLYTLLEFMDRGLSGHDSFKSFREEYAVLARRADGSDVEVALKEMPKLKGIVNTCALIVRKDEVLKDLPPKQYDILEVEMTKRQTDDYDSLEKQFILEIEKDIEDAENSGDEGKRQIVVNNALVKLMKLAQITSGFLNVPEERDEEGEIIQPATRIEYKPNPKLDVLVEEAIKFTRDRPKEKAIVWCSFRYDVEQICKRFEAAGIPHVRFEGATKDADRTEAERRFNQDASCRWWVGSAAAGGVGLNLLGYTPGLNEADGTNTTWEIYHSQSHKPVERWQSEDRAHRRGTRVPVRITDLVVPATIDEDVRVRVAEKKKHALDMQDLRAIMDTIIKRREERGAK